MNLRFHQRALDDVFDGRKVIDELEGHAKAIVSSARGRAPSKMKFRTRAGKGPKGAFAQAIMSGSGAMAVEWGSKNNPPYAPLRGALADHRKS